MAKSVIWSTLSHGNEKNIINSVLTTQYMKDEYEKTFSWKIKNIYNNTILLVIKSIKTDDK